MGMDFKGNKGEQTWEWERGEEITHSTLDLVFTTPEADWKSEENQKIDSDYWIIGGSWTATEPTTDIRVVECVDWERMEEDWEKRKEWTPKQWEKELEFLKGPIAYDKMK